MQTEREREEKHIELLYVLELQGKSLQASIPILPILATICTTETWSKLLLEHRELRQVHMCRPTQLECAEASLASALTVR